MIILERIRGSKEETKKQKKYSVNHLVWRLSGRSRSSRSSIWSRGWRRRCQRERSTSTSLGIRFHGRWHMLRMASIPIIGENWRSRAKTRSLWTFMKMTENRHLLRIGWRKVRNLTIWRSGHYIKSVWRYSWWRK